MCWKDCLFPIVLPLLFSQESVGRYLSGSISGLWLCSVVYVSILLMVPHCLEYCSFIISLGVGNSSPPTFFFSSMLCLAFRVFFPLHINFTSNLLISKITCWDFDWTYRSVESNIKSGRTDILIQYWFILKQYWFCLFFTFGYIQPGISSFTTHNNPVRQANSKMRFREAG